ncbi:MAG: hypothetical protein Kow0056_09100 [Coriobacteriia bacterium]
MEKKTNCWEYKNCGRGPGGDLVEELGQCPVSTLESVNGIHDGKNGGRCCWAVVGSDSNAARSESDTWRHPCEECDFPALVLDEELELETDEVISEIIREGSKNRAS